MADIHILANNGKRAEYEVVFHFAVPEGNNFVVVSYRVAIVNSGLGGTTRLDEGEGPGQIATVEKTAIEAGEVYEHRITFKAEGNGDSAAAVQEMLRRQYARDTVSVLADLQARLKYYGHTESES